MKVLVANVGSTSLKYGLYEMPAEELLARGRIERVGMDVSPCSTWSQRGESSEDTRLRDYPSAIQYMKSVLTHPQRGAIHSLDELDAVGFKVVHARGYSGCQLLSDEVLQAMRDYYVVAPVHNPPYVRAIELFRESLPGTPLVGLFETAFHQTMPDYADTYGIPLEWKEKYGIRRSGFHGASHRYLVWRTAQLLGKPAEEVNLITCHLGGSSSISAIRRGESVDNSFGFSTQSGLSATTRCGDIDPFIIPYLVTTGDYTLEQVCDILARQGGLRGIAGMDPDMRELEKAAQGGHRRARLAIDSFVYAIKKYIGAYLAVLGRVDALVFSGGIGEHSMMIRQRVCSGLEGLGIYLDSMKNQETFAREACVSSPNSRIAIWVVPTNEEIVVARAVVEKLKGNQWSINFVLTGSVFNLQVARTQAKA